MQTMKNSIQIRGNPLRHGGRTRRATSPYYGEADKGAFTSFYFVGIVCKKLPTRPLEGRRFGFLSAENQKRKPRGLPHAVSDGAFAALWVRVHHIEGSAFTEPTLPWGA